MVMFADNKMYNKDYKKVNVGGGGGGGGWKGGKKKKGLRRWHRINGRILQEKMLRNSNIGKNERS